MLICDCGSLSKDVIPVALLIPCSMLFSTSPRRIESTTIPDFSSLAVTASGSMQDLKGRIEVMFAALITL